MGDNLKMFSFKTELEALINSYELPIMAKRVVLELVLKNVEDVSEEILQQETEAEKREESEEKEDGLSTDLCE